MDSGRRDGAPLPGKGKGSGGSGGGSAQQDAQSSGTTTQPAQTGTTSTPTSTDKTKNPGGASDSDPSSIHSANGYGSSSNVPGTKGGEQLASVSGGGSSTPSYVLIAVVALIAIWIGFSLAGSARKP